MRKTFIILAITAILLTSCGLQNGIENTEQTTTTSDITGDTNTELSENEPPSTPKTNKELYSFLLEAWKNDRISELKYVSGRTRFSCR